MAIIIPIMVGQQIKLVIVNELMVNAKQIKVIQQQFDLQQIMAITIKQLAKQQLVKFIQQLVIKHELL